VCPGTGFGSADVARGYDCVCMRQSTYACVCVHMHVDLPASVHTYMDAANDRTATTPSDGTLRRSRGRAEERSRDMHCTVLCVCVCVHLHACIYMPTPKPEKRTSRHVSTCTDAVCTHGGTSPYIPPTHTLMTRHVHRTLTHTTHTHRNNHSTDPRYTPQPTRRLDRGTGQSINTRTATVTAYAHHNTRKYTEDTRTTTVTPPPTHAHTCSLVPGTEHHIHAQPQPQHTHTTHTHHDSHNTILATIVHARAVIARTPQRIP